MRLGQNLSFQSQENFSKIQEQMSLFSTPKRFEDMNVRSSAKVPKKSFRLLRTTVRVCNLIKF